MFDVHCPRCATRVLLDESRIEAVVNEPDGIVVRYRCWCGTPGMRPRVGAGATSWWTPLTALLDPFLGVPTGNSCLPEVPRCAEMASVVWASVTSGFE